MVDPTLSTLQIGMGWFPQQPGGLNRMYYNLVEHLSEVNVGVKGLVTGSSGLNTDIGVSAFSETDSSLPRRLYHARRAARESLRHGHDLVISHFALYTFPWLDLIGDRPLIVHFHGPWALEGGVENGNRLSVYLKKYIERAVYRNADRFIVLSNAFRTILNQTYEVPLNRIDIVPGGVDANRFDVPETQSQARLRLGWPTDRPIVFCIRRLAHRMGLETLIDAMVEVRRHVPDALLLIAGKGPLAPALQAQIDANGLTDAVQLLGFVADEDLPYAYRSASLSIVPTRSLEGFGLITIESLASGTPVLVTPVGGLPETVQHLDPGLILQGTDRSHLANGLLRALRSPDQLPSSAECIRYVRENYDWPIIARQTRDVYQNVLTSYG